jgi:hypothetical protein
LRIPVETIEVAFVAVRRGFTRAALKQVTIKRISALAVLGDEDQYQNHSELRNHGGQFGQKWSNSPLVALSLFVLIGDIAIADASRTMGTSRG